MNNNFFNARGGDGAQGGDGPSYEPWNDITGEKWKDDKLFDEVSERIQSEILTESIESDFNRAYMTVILKALFDILTSLGGITGCVREGMLRSLLQLGSEEVFNCYKENESEGSDGEMMKAVAKARDKSMQRFFSLFNSQLLSDVFVAEFKKQAQRNLKKKKEN